MKSTPLNRIHHQLKAKMVEFGGYEMPVSYSSIKGEHQCVREKLGVFDVSHMGQFIIQGPKSIKLLQNLCSNDITQLRPGKAQYNYFPNHNGGVVDDLIVYQLEEQKYLLVVNASNIEKNWKWVTKINKDHGAKMTNASSQFSLLAVQGPKALEAMQQLTDYDLNSLPFYSHTTTRFAGIENVIVATTGYTGAGGLELYVANQDIETLWDQVLMAGQIFGIQPIGLAARDTLRLEMGYCLYGNELNETTSPIAAGLGWVTRPETQCVNAKQLAVEKKYGTPIKLVGLKLLERGIPRNGHTLLSTENEIIGTVTSGTQSPSLNIGIALAYVKREFAQIDTTVIVQNRNKNVFAKVVKLPFFQRT